jgi:hypothetical protein
MPSRPSRPLPAVLALVLVMLAAAACTGRGGGYLPPDGLVFTGKGVFGFTFSCERSSRSTSTNPPTGQLRLELSYADLGANPAGGPFSVHGVADILDPVLESAVCVGQEPPPGGNELIFLGRYRVTSGAPAGYAAACPARETGASPACRFEVIVRDNDGDLAPSAGDFFSIRLTTVTSTTVTDPPVGTVLYARAGLLAGGNLTVD